MTMIPRIQVSFEIGDKNANGRVDVSGEIRINGRGLRLEPRDLPRADLMSAVSALLGAFKLSPQQLVEIALPSLSPRSLIGALTAELTPKPKRKKTETA